MVDLDTHLTIILRFESILRRAENLKDFKKNPLESNVIIKCATIKLLDKKKTNFVITWNSVVEVQM